MKVLSVAPTRLSLFGGGTDIEPYASKFGGLVISMAINIRQEITLDRLSNDWSLPVGATDGFYIPFFNEFNEHTLTGLKAVFDGEITGGLGSSASAAVALVGALGRLTGTKMSREEIAERAWDIEVNKLKMFGGKQDQYAAAFGGINVFEFSKKVDVTPLSQGFIAPVFDSIVLFHTGENRKSAVIQNGYKDLTETKITYLDRIKKIAFESLEVILTGDIEKFGKLVDKAWIAKKMSNSGVSSPKIHQIYKKAKSIGAYGGKVMGAGGGGYMFFVVDPDKKQEFINQIGLKHIDFSIDWNGLDTRIL